LNVDEQWCHVMMVIVHLDLTPPFDSRNILCGTIFFVPPGQRHPGRQNGFSYRSTAPGYCIVNAILKTKAHWECKMCLMLMEMLYPRICIVKLPIQQMAKTSVLYRMGYYNRNEHQIEPSEGLNQHFTRFWCFYPSYAPCCRLQPAKAPQISKSRRWC